MKEKIKAALVNKYKNLGFSDKAIEGVLAYLETTVTDEAGIEGAVNAVEGMLKAFQSEVDTRVGVAVNKPKPPTPAPTPEGPAQQEPVNPPADAPEWAKGLLESVKTLTTEVSTLKAGKTADSRKTRLEEMLKDSSDAFKKTTLKSFDRMAFKDDAEFDAYLEEVKTDAAEFVQTEANNGLRGQSKPNVSTGGNNIKQASKEQVKEAMKHMA